MNLHKSLRIPLSAPLYPLRCNQPLMSQAGVLFICQCVGQFQVATNHANRTANLRRGIFRAKTWRGLVFGSLLLKLPVAATFVSIALTHHRFHQNIPPGSTYLSPSIPSSAPRWVMYILPSMCNILSPRFPDNSPSFVHVVRRRCASRPRRSLD